MRSKFDYVELKNKGFVLGGFFGKNQDCYEDLQEYTVLLRV